MVDDDPAIRNFTANALTYCVNREVISFKNGLAAWRYIENGGEVHMVISDVNMPEMDGFELLAKVKEKQKEIIFIVLSGRPANEERAEREGADAFLAKPFAVNDLFDIVQTYVVG